MFSFCSARRHFYEVSVCLRFSFARRVTTVDGNRMASNNRRRLWCTYCFSTISDERGSPPLCEDRVHTTTRVRSQSGFDDVISVSAPLRETIMPFGCSGKQRFDDGTDFDAKFQLLVRDIRRDFDAVDGVIKVMEKKVNNLEMLLHSMQNADRLQLVEAGTTKQSVRLEQVSGKCDQILRRLDYIESKFAPMIGSKNAHRTSSDGSMQMIQILDSLNKLSNQLTAQSSDISSIKTRLTKISSRSHAHSEPSTITRRKLVSAKILELNPKHSISSGSSYRSLDTPSSLDVTPSPPNLKPSIADRPHQLSDDSTAHLRARLKDPKIMNMVRAYLAFLHNQPSTVLYDGMTSVSAKMLLGLEGFPVDVTKLKEIYVKIHEDCGITKESVEADLETYRAFIATERIQRLQRARESTDKFYGRNGSKTKDPW